MTDVVTGPGRHTGFGADPVGTSDIARLAGVEPDTVHEWRQRHADFPAPDWAVGGRPAWRVDQVEAWLRKTGRLPAGHPANQRIRDLAGRVRDLLTERAGQWVSWNELLTLAPERVDGGGYAHDLDDPDNETAFGDDATGAHPVRRTGKPDGSALQDAMGLVRKWMRRPDSGPAMKVDEGYPAGAGRSFRLVHAKEDS